MVTILQGDCIDQMRRLPAESVHLIVTSPPYWGLRDYGVPPSIWSDPVAASLCEAHEWGDKLPPRPGRGNKPGDFSTSSLTNPKRQDVVPRASNAGAFCQTCNAWRGVFGLEPTPDLYIAHLVAIMREAKRVLRKDGTLWLNLGDSYAASGGGRRDHGNGFNSVVGKSADAAMPRAGRVEQRRYFKTIGLRPGDLVGIPWRAVFALQADGWWHRRDNIWFKPNPMPESVNGWRWEKHRVKSESGRRKVDWKVRPKGWQAGEGSHDTIAKGNYRQNGGEVAEYVNCLGCEKCAPNDGLILRKGNWRCTTSHEYVFQFSKSDSYFCDAEAARERTTGNAHGRGHGVNPKAKLPGKNSRIHVDRDVAHVAQTGRSKRPRQNESFSAAVAGLVGNRNRRSVWRIATKPYRGAHFATFPPDLVRPIIAAASPVHCCGECGAPYAPVILRGEPDRDHQRACGSDRNGHYNGKATKNFVAAGAEDASAVKARILAGMVVKTVVGYRPTCRCHRDVGSDLFAEGDIATPATVLDPFGGSGTVGQAAQELGRSAILIELSQDYIPLIEKRCGLSSQPLNSSTSQLP